MIHLFTSPSSAPFFRRPSHYHTAIITLFNDITRIVIHDSFLKRENSILLACSSLVAAHRILRRSRQNPDEQHSISKRTLVSRDTNPTILWELFSRMTSHLHTHTCTVLQRKRERKCAGAIATKIAAFLPLRPSESRCCHIFRSQHSLTCISHSLFPLCH